MKRSLLVFGVISFLVLFTSQAFAQTTIPNAGFENWTGGNPDGWTTTNAPPAYTNVTKSSTAHSGTGSARGEVVSISPSFPVPMPPLMQSGVAAAGFFYTQRPGFLTGWYQFSTSSNNRLVITVVLTKGTLGSKIIAAGGTSIATAASTWQQFSVPLLYSFPDTPDTCFIQISIAGPPTGGQAAIGSVFFIDDLAFSGTASAVEDASVPQAFSLEQNYPNPFNPSTTIRFSLAQSGQVSLKVFNVLGVEVASIVNEKREAGTFSVNWNAAGLPSGMYLYRLSVTSEEGQVFDQSKKLVLLK